MRCKRRSEEQVIHKTIVSHLMARGVRDLVFLHPANGGARSPIEGAILKTLGVIPGAPDLLLWHEGRSFALEVKTEVGRATEAQLELLDRLSTAGVFTAIVHGLDRALAVLEAWGLLKGRAA